jgi:moderate conductance mechanosensitive channel
MQGDITDKVYEEVTSLFTTPSAMGSFIILILSFIAAYYLSKLLAAVIVRIAQAVAVRSDSATSEEKLVKLRQVETYLSVTVAMIRVVVVLVVGYLTWSIIARDENTAIATIGASAVFVVLASGTVGPLLRDITSGATMIIERWFTVGDFIRLEPFSDLGGVVERITLRSTKVRSLNGEVVWVHNQHIQAVRVTPKGVRTLEVDVFVRDLAAGRVLVQRAGGAIPSGTMTMVSKIKIISEEQWGDRLWVLTVQGQTPPGREWLIDDYFVSTVKELDAENDTHILARKPLVRFADSAAERSFKRAVRSK